MASNSRETTAALQGNSGRTVDMDLEEEEIVFPVSRRHSGRRGKGMMILTITLVVVVIGVVTGVAVTMLSRHDADQDGTMHSSEQGNENLTPVISDMLDARQVPVNAQDDASDQKSRSPTVTPMPTPDPTIAPSPPTIDSAVIVRALPTPDPTTSPSDTPTTRPTRAPTLRPTRAPTSRPTEAPTLRPTLSLARKWLDATVTKADGVMYDILDVIPHDPSAFTQGLTYANGLLYESTGLRGQSTVRVLDPNTGNVLTRVDMPTQYFGEGMTFYNGKLIQITWTSRTGFVYDTKDITKPPVPFQIRTTKNDEGWGITLNPTTNELIVSDGSNNLIFWDPLTFEILRTVPVFRQNGVPAWRLNELEYWRDRVIANVWKEEVLLVIHPTTGQVEKEYDMSKLWPFSERPAGADVLNGISVSDEPDVLFVTGKKWNRMFKLKLLP